MNNQHHFFDNLILLLNSIPIIAAFIFGTYIWLRNLTKDGPPIPNSKSNLPPVPSAKRFLLLLLIAGTIFNAFIFCFLSLLGGDIEGVLGMFSFLAPGVYVFSIIGGMVMYGLIAIYR